ncbi:MAG: hypothetical protein HUJ94_07960 [Bacteroidales bacterium]|mgnify:CR=1 FL=1|nr:hypothetical protein [Bacteroidales bacterium]
MKLFFKWMGLAGMILSSALVSSCDDGKGPDDDANVPFKSITLTCDGETATGVVEGQNVTFVFDQAEDFSSATIAVELNKGYTMTHPTSLTGVDLASTPVFNFTDKNSKLIKYYISFVSNAFPIVSAAKMQIEGLGEGENITLDNVQKVITIKYDRDRMDYESIVLNFLEGSLLDGVKLPENLNFAISDGIEQKLVLNLNGERVYTLKFDVSAYQKKQLSEYGFSDESFKYNLDENSPVKVYATTALPNIPVNVATSTQCTPDWSWNFTAPICYGVPNARIWDGGIYREDVEDLYASQGWFDWTYDDIFTFPGDWKDDRELCNTYGRLVVVLIDQEKVKVGMQGATSGIKFGSCNNLVVATGLSNSATYGHYLLNIGGQSLNALEPAESTGYVPYRAAIGTKGGKVKFGVVAPKNGTNYEIPFQDDYKSVNKTNLYSSADKVWEADNTAWVAAMGIHEGKALGINDIVANDGTNYISDMGVLGMGWGDGFYWARTIVGTTYDNKIAIMINAPGGDNWESIEGYPNVDNGGYYSNVGFNFIGYSLKQMFWLASQLGWKNAASLGQSENASAPGYAGCVKVNGVSVFTDAELAAISWDAGAYADNGKEITAGYMLTVDKK